jgi:hypothetical protein
MEHLQQFNWLVTLLTGLIVPNVLGMLYYNPKLMGNAWMKEAGLTMDDAKGVNMGKAMALNTLASLSIAVGLNLFTIHQFAINSIFAGAEDMKALTDPNSQQSLYVADFMSRYGHYFRTFKHGFTHGVLLSIFFVGPVLAYSCIWERKSFKYWIINVVFWILNLGIMGGIICQWT